MYSFGYKPRMWHYILYLHFINLYLVIQIVLQYILCELDLKWDIFIGCSRHFNSRCAHIKYVLGWENLIRADLWMNFIVINVAIHKIMLNWLEVWLITIKFIHKSALIRFSHPKTYFMCAHRLLKCRLQPMKISLISFPYMT
jgi:hypothetical protein